MSSKRFNSKTIGIRVAIPNNLQFIEPLSVIDTRLIVEHLVHKFAQHLPERIIFKANNAEGTLKIGGKKIRMVSKPWTETVSDTELTFEPVDLQLRHGKARLFELEWSEALNDSSKWFTWQSPEYEKQSFNEKLELMTETERVLALKAKYGDKFIDKPVGKILSNLEKLEKAKQESIAMEEEESFQYTFPHRINELYGPNNKIYEWFKENVLPFNLKRRKFLVLYSEERELGKTEFVKDLVAQDYSRYIYVSGLDFHEKNFKPKENTAKILLLDDFEWSPLKEQILKQLLTSQECNIDGKYLNYNFKHGIPVVVTTNVKKQAENLATHAMTWNQCVVVCIKDFIGPPHTKPKKLERRYAGIHTLQLIRDPQHQSVNNNEMNEDSNESERFEEYSRLQRVNDSERLEEYLRLQKAKYRHLTEDQKMNEFFPPQMLPFLATRRVGAPVIMQMFQNNIIVHTPPRSSQEMQQQPVEQHQNGKSYDQMEVIHSPPFQTDHAGERSPVVPSATMTASKGRKGERPEDIQALERQTTMKKRAFSSKNDIHRGVKDRNENHKNNQSDKGCMSPLPQREEQKSMILHTSSPLLLSQKLSEMNHIIEKTEICNLAKLRKLLTYAEKKLKQQQQLLPHQQLQQQLQKENDQFYALVAYYRSFPVSVLQSRRSRSNDGSSLLGLSSTQVRYLPSARERHSGQGRLYAHVRKQGYTEWKSGGMQVLKKRYRGYLANDLYWDIDLVNAHPSIMLYLLEEDTLAVTTTTKTARSKTEEMRQLREYVTLRETFLTEIITVFSTTRENAKELVLRYLYGGNYQSWSDDMGINLPSTSPLYDKLHLFAKELKLAGSLLRARYPKITASAEGDGTNDSYHLQLILSEKEKEIMNWADHLLREQYGRPLEVLIHDGGHIRRLLHEQYFPLNLLEGLNEAAKKEFGTTWIRFEHKPFDTSLAAEVDQEVELFV